MAETKTKLTKRSVRNFIAKLKNDTRRRDAEALLRIFEKATGWKAQMWGATIVGYGRYKYVYDTGRTGEICVVGFSPRTANLVIYQHSEPSGKTTELLMKLGKHKGGMDSCLYINKLADINLGVLEKLIKLGVSTLKKRAAEKQWPVSAR